MKSQKKIFIILVIIYCINVLSCTCKCKEDVDFKNFYFKKIDDIISYDKNMSTVGYSFTEDYWFKFYDTIWYLERLTNQKTRYVGGEPPLYSKKSDLKKDIRSFKNWYKENKCGMSIEKADSIIYESYF